MARAAVAETTRMRRLRKSMLKIELFEDESFGKVGAYEDSGKYEIAELLGCSDDVF